MRNIALFSKVSLSIIWKPINLQCRAIDWFQYGKNIGHKYVKNWVQYSVEFVNPLMPGDNKRAYVLKQTCSF